MRKVTIYLALALSALLVVSAPVFAAEITISAAASLKEALVELTGIYSKQHPGVTFLKNFGASGSLAQQIDSGAPADIFISASPEWIEYLKRKGGVQEKSVRPFTYNTLVFVARSDSQVKSLSNLLSLERIALGSPKSVPAGAYAMEALRKAGLDKQLEKRLVLAKDVREALMYAQRGDVAGAFVYRTDALQTRQVSIRFTVTSLSTPILYPMALTEAGSKKPEVLQFYRFLQEGIAREVLDRYGFSRN